MLYDNIVAAVSRKKYLILQLNCSYDFKQKTINNYNNINDNYAIL